VYNYKKYTQKLHLEIKVRDRQDTGLA